MKRNLPIEEANFKQALKIMMAEAGIDSMAALAKEIDMKETTFRSAINKQTLRLKDFILLADILGFKIVIQDKKGEGEID